MNTSKPDGGPAFPKAGLDAWGKAVEVHTGMTLRDYFAGQALIGLVQNGGLPHPIAQRAYELADAMLEARK